MWPPSLPPRWIETCVEEELPPTTELEEALRNGVILCKLGHYYAPDVVPLRKVYDMDESKYRVSRVKCVLELVYALSCCVNWRT